MSQSFIQAVDSKAGLEANLSSPFLIHVTKGTEEEACAPDQLSTEPSPVSLPSWSPEPLLGAERLACQRFGVISLFIFWENLQVQQPFFGIYFSHPTDGLLPP